MSSTELNQSTTDIITKLSPRSMTQTASRHTDLLSARGITLFAAIPQRAEAQKVGLELRETRPVIFGNPIQRTPVMVAAPLAALDLPLKVLVWKGGDQTQVSYRAPSALAVRYDLSPDLADRLAGINAVTDGLVALGVSVDRVWSHAAFGRALGLTFPLLADFHLKGAVSGAHGVYQEDEGRSHRTLAVLDAAGRVVWSRSYPTNPNPGIDGMVSALERMQAQEIDQSERRQSIPGGER